MRVRLKECRFLYALIATAIFLASHRGFAGTSESASTHPLIFKDHSDFTLKNLTFRGSKDNCILLQNCRNVLIQDSHFYDATGEGVHLINCTSVTVTGCTFESVRSGVYAVGSSSIRVTCNRFLNMRGPMPRGQLVQFDKVYGRDNRISDNMGINEPGKSTPEDAISIYKCEGVPDDSILVERNQIRGGGPSKSGGGIMLGDGGGRYIIARHNQLVNPGQYGIAVAGGTEIRVENNVVFGRPQPFTNVGLYVWNQGADNCGAITVTGNRVWWLNSEGKANPAWDAGTCGPIVDWETNSWQDKSIVVPDDFPVSAINP